MRGCCGNEGALLSGVAGRRPALQGMKWRGEGAPEAASGASDTGMLRLGKLANYVVLCPLNFARQAPAHVERDAEVAIARLFRQLGEVIFQV